MGRTGLEVRYWSTRERYLSLAKALVRRDGLRVPVSEPPLVATRIAAVALLTTAPLIGPITASAMVATIDDGMRFRSAHQFEAFLGLVPGERSSGEKRRVGRIAKTGNPRVRYLLFEAAWRILWSKSEETAALRAWALRIAERRGKRIAVVALDRRLAGVLYAMWRDNAPYAAPPP